MKHFKFQPVLWFRKGLKKKKKKEKVRKVVKGGET